MKTIFFDLGNVLLFFSHDKMYRQIGASFGISPMIVKELLSQKGLQTDYETGAIKTMKIYQIFHSHAQIPCSFEQFLEAAADIFTPNISLWPLVEKLKQQGLRLVLLSNTSECHFNYAKKRYPIFSLFDDKILSFEVGAMKPDEKIFRAALSLAHCHPKECFYIDDIPEFIEGAKKVGLEGVLYTGVDPLKKALTDRGLLLK